MDVPRVPGKRVTLIGPGHTAAAEEDRATKTSRATQVKTSVDLITHVAAGSRDSGTLHWLRWHRQWHTSINTNTSWPPHLVSKPATAHRPACRLGFLIRRRRRRIHYVIRRVLPSVLESSSRADAILSEDDPWCVK